MKIDEGNRKLDTVLMFGVFAAMALLFVALSQPIWRPQGMIADLKDECDQQGGIVTVRKGLFANSYSCKEPWGAKATSGTIEQVSKQ